MTLLEFLYNLFTAGGVAILLYVVARFMTAAYFKSKKDYEEQKDEQKKEKKF